MLSDRILPQSEVIAAILLEDSPCCGVPHQQRVRRAPDVGVPHAWLGLVRPRVVEPQLGRRPGRHPQPNHSTQLGPGCQQNPFRGD